MPRQKFKNIDLNIAAIEGSPAFEIEAIRQAMLENCLAGFRLVQVGIIDRERSGLGGDLVETVAQVIDAKA